MVQRITNLTPRRRAMLAFNGGLMFLLGLLAGLAYTFVLIGRIEAWPLLPSLEVTQPTMLSAAHTEAWPRAHLGLLVNAITLFAIAGIGKTLMLRERAQNVLVCSVLITGWFNIAGFVTAAVFNTRGLAFGGSPANIAVYLFFLVAVVSAFVQAVLIVLGAWRGMRTIGLG